MPEGETSPTCSAHEQLRDPAIRPRRGRKYRHTAKTGPPFPQKRQYGKGNNEEHESTGQGGASPQWPRLFQHPILRYWTVHWFAKPHLEVSPRKASTTQGPLLVRREREVELGAQTAGISGIPPWARPDLPGFSRRRVSNLTVAPSRWAAYITSPLPNYAAQAGPICFHRVYYPSCAQHCALCTTHLYRGTTVLYHIAHRLDHEQSFPANEKYRRPPRQADGQKWDQIKSPDPSIPKPCPMAFYSIGLLGSGQSNVLFDANHRTHGSRS
jgi:hypothetical protein